MCDDEEDAPMADEHAGGDGDDGGGSSGDDDGIGLGGRRAAPVRPPASAEEEAAAAAAAAARLEEVGSLENPQLQKHYSVLQAVALREEALDWDANKDDQLNPPAPIEAVARGPVAALFAALPEPPQKAAAKRKAEDGGGGGGKKTASGNGEARSDASWKDMVESGAIAKETVGVLKEFCKANGLKLGGKKQDLVDRITEHFMA